MLSFDTVMPLSRHGESSMARACFDPSTTHSRTGTPVACSRSWYAVASARGMSSSVEFATKTGGSPGVANVYGEEATHEEGHDSRGQPNIGRDRARAVVGIAALRARHGAVR